LEDLLANVGQVANDGVAASEGTAKKLAVGVEGRHLPFALFCLVCFVYGTATLLFVFIISHFL